MSSFAKAVLWVALLGTQVSLAVADAPAPSRAEFVDKWLLNGGNLGGAAGAVIGQLIGQRLLPGPIGVVVGSFAGNLAGSLVGEYADNKVGRSYNYAAFKRPALGEPGALVLKDAGRWERALYLVDRWAVSGGAMATMTMHYGLNLLARRIPGAGYLAAPLFLFVADYAAGCIGDNIDGAIDFSQVGRRLDERARPPARTEDRAAAYRGVVGESKDGDPARMAAALQRYREAVSKGRTEETGR